MLQMNYPHSLPVEVGGRDYGSASSSDENDVLLIGSEVEPIKLGLLSYAESGGNGVGHKKYGFIVVQQGTPYLVVTTSEVHTYGYETRSDTDSFEIREFPLAKNEKIAIQEH